MADANSLRVIYIFEACARLRCRSEIAALAAHIYHRFFRIKPDMSQFELYIFGSACIMLAHRFYEMDLKAEDLAMVAASIVHGPDYYLGAKMVKKLATSINVTSLVIAVNTNFEITYKDERLQTPGDLLRSIRTPGQEVIELSDDDDNDAISVDSEVAEVDTDEAEYLLTSNCKHLISSHRYLAHYLYSIKILVEPGVYNLFGRLCNLAWTFLNDFHWSPSVMGHLPDHIACSCLMMASQISTKELEKCSEEEEPEKVQFYKLIDKRWNLIFCDDLPNEKLSRTIYTIIKNYAEYERIFRKEFTTDVIDP